MFQQTIGKTQTRPLSALVLLLAVPFVAGCLLSPFVFHVLEKLRWFADTPFERVNNRCVLLLVVLLLIPALRMAGLGRKILHDLNPGREGPRDLIRGLATAFTSIASLYFIGSLLGAYSLSYKIGSFWNILVEIIAALAGAVFVGVFEEAFFRGFIFGALKQRTGAFAGALAGSIFFAWIHFFRPDAPVEITDPHWYSGFALLPHLFARFSWANDWPYLALLLLMGLTLCVLYEKRGNLIYPVALHGGWVFAMQLGAFFLDRNKTVLAGVFGTSDFIAKSPLALIVMIGFLIWALRSRGNPFQGLKLPR